MLKTVFGVTEKFLKNPKNSKCDHQEMQRYMISNDQIITINLFIFGGSRRSPQVVFFLLVTQARNTPLCYNKTAML